MLAKVLAQNTSQYAHPPFYVVFGGGVRFDSGCRLSYMKECHILLEGMTFFMRNLRERATQ